MIDYRRALLTLHGVPAFTAVSSNTVHRRECAGLSRCAQCVMNVLRDVDPWLKGKLPSPRPGRCCTRPSISCSSPSPVPRPVSFVLTKICSQSDGLKHL